MPHTSKPRPRPAVPACFARYAVTIALVLAAVPAAPAGELPARWDLPALMAALPRQTLNRVEFIEIKTVSLLKQPLQVSGVLSFNPPAQLEKRITRPVEELYRVDGDRLTIERPAEGLRQELSLSAYPALWAFVESIRAPLAGDLPTLERFYRVSLGGSRRNWLLALVPREPEMAALVRSVQIRGGGDRMRELAIEEANGDHSVLQIQWPR